MILPTNIIWESSLSALMLTLGLWGFIAALKSGSRRAWVLLGTYWAIACLVNAALLLLLPAFLLFDYSRNRDRRSRAICCLAALLLCLIPWGVRNYAIFHKFFPLRDNFALELWIGNHTGATTRFTPEIHPAFSMTELRRYQSLGEIGYMAEKRDIAIGFIEARPLLFVKNTAQRAFTYWFVNWHALWLLVPIITLGGFIGMGLLLARSHPFAWIFWIPLLIYPLPYYITHPDLRYQHPLQPLLVILCAYAITRRGSGESTSSISREAVEVGA